MKKLLIIPMLFICSIVIGQSKKIIGNPIRLQKFEVAQHDFPKAMTWKDAKAACAKLGKGWRLPTKNELNVMYKNKDKIGGFANDNFYWSSTVVGGTNAFFQGFLSGFQEGTSKSNSGYVRAVRAF